MSGSSGGISLGAVVTGIGILMLIFFSIFWGIIVILIGLIAFGGFAKGKWY